MTDDTFSSTCEGRALAVGIAAQLTNLSIPFQMTFETEEESVSRRTNPTTFTVYTFTVNHRFQSQLEKLVQDG